MTRNEEQQEESLLQLLVLITLPWYEIRMTPERLLSESGPMKLICVFPDDVSFVDLSIKIHINWFPVTEACEEELIDI